MALSLSFSSWKYTQQDLHLQFPRFEISSCSIALEEAGLANNRWLTPSPASAAAAHNWLSWLMTGILPT